MTDNQYFDLLFEEFPTVKNNIIEEDEEGIHFKMETFADHTIEQIEINNQEELLRCFEFQESKIPQMSEPLFNALVVSYCESMLLGEVASKMSSIIPLFPPKLKKVYIEYELHYSQLGNNS